MSSLPVSPKRLVLFAALIALVACAANMTITVTTPQGSVIEITLKGTIGAIPPGWTPLDITGMYQGESYELFDGDGDGNIDAARKIGGTSVVRISPVPIPSPNEDFAPHPLPGGPGGPVAPVGRVLDRSHGLFYAKPCELPIDFVATDTAANLLLEHGFDPLRGLPVTTSELLDVNRARFGLNRLGELDALYLDVTMHWDGRFGWPLDVEAFPALGYNYHNVSDVPGEIGPYWFLQADGPAESVLAWLSAFGISELTSPEVVLSQSGQPDTVLHDLTLSIDAGGGQAHAYLDGEFVLSLELP